jgi:hypothetical protein
MSQPDFTNAGKLAARIDAYFNFIEGEYHLEDKPGKETKDQPAPNIKVWDREPEPATFAGLALFLEFNSLQAFDDYIENGEFAAMLKLGRLRIEASYERKLHNQSATGAIFALKRMGWNDREDKQSGDQMPKTLKMVIYESGPAPAESEKEVIL